MRWVPILLVLAVACGIPEPDYWAFSSGTATVSTSNGTSTYGGFTGVAIWTSDSPLEELDGVHVVFDRVELRQGTRRVVLRDDPLKVELLALQNGVRRRIANGVVEPGFYDSLRVRLATTGHSIERGGHAEPLELAAGARTELVFDGPLRLRADEELELQLDFNVRLSVVEAGGRFRLAPQGALHDPNLAGAIEGTALPAGTRVSAQRDGLELASTTSRSDGYFRIFPVEPGPCDLVAHRSGHRPEIVRGIRVVRAATAGGHHFLLEPESQHGSVSGWASTAGGGGLVVRLVWRGTLLGIAGVDPASGRFEFPSVPADEFDVELWDGYGPLGQRESVLVESGIDSLLEFR